MTSLLEAVAEPATYQRELMLDLEAPDFEKSHAG
jgi:hypothetical protein